MSEDDLLAENQRWLIRIQFDTACHVQKLIPYRYEDRPGELYERRGKTWKLIGYVMPEDNGSSDASWLMNGRLMKDILLLLVGFVLSACATPRQRPISFVPAKEAAWFKFPLDLPAEGQVRIPAPIAGAIQLVVDDFVPWNLKPPGDADVFDACTYEQASYVVNAAPGPEGVVFVSIWLSPGACGDAHWALDQGATYAVDVRNWRILAIQH